MNNRKLSIGIILVTMLILTGMFLPSQVMGQENVEFNVKVGDKKTYEIIKSVQNETSIQLKNGSMVNVSTKVGVKFIVEVTKVNSNNVTTVTNYGNITTKEGTSGVWIFPVRNKSYWESLASNSTNILTNTTATYENGFFTVSSDNWNEYLGTTSRYENIIKYSTETGWIEEYTYKVTMNGMFQSESSVKAVNSTVPGFEFISLISGFIFAVPVIIYKKRRY